MFGDKKIIFVSVLDSNNRSYQELTRRIADHQKTVTDLIKTGSCLIGRKTQEMTGWKGEGAWVLTGNKKWRRNQVSVIHNLEDARLHMPGNEIFVLGGISLFKQLEKNVDEFMLWNINDKSGNESWISLDMSAWKPISYNTQNNWTYAKLTRIRK